MSPAALSLFSKPQNNSVIKGADGEKGGGKGGKGDKDLTRGIGAELRQSIRKYSFCFFHLFIRKWIDSVTARITTLVQI